MAMNIRKALELKTLAPQGARREDGRFVGFLAASAEPTAFLSSVAARPWGETDPYASCRWVVHAMNQSDLRAGRPAV